MAKTGTGAPVTEKFEKYTTENSPLNIYDTVGLELGQNPEKEALQQIKGIIKDVKRSGKGDQIDCIWYCVSAASSGFQDFEKKAYHQAFRRV